MEEKNDLRIVKTKKALYQALLELMKDKSFDEIKVSDICNIALINRSTFYAHYEDKYELFLDYINSMKGNLLLELAKNKEKFNSKEFYISMISILLDHIDDKKDVYKATVINNKNSLIMDIFLDVIIKDVNNRIKLENIDTGEIPVEIVTKFYIGAVIMIVIDWISGNTKYSKEDLVKYLSELIPENIGK